MNFRNIDYPKILQITYYVTFVLTWSFIHIPWFPPIITVPITMASIISMAWVFTIHIKDVITESYDSDDSSSDDSSEDEPPITDGKTGIAALAAGCLAYPTGISDNHSKHE